MKKIFKITLIFLILMCIMSMFNNYIYADDIIDGMNPNGWNISSNQGTFITKFFGMVLGVLQVASMGVIVFSIVYLGIKYMVSSVNDKATIKQQMMPIIIGGVIIFSASTLLKWISTFTAEAFK